MMNLISTIKKSFGDWYKYIDKSKYYTVLTDDIDSYLSCLFLKKKFGIEIGGFYDFKSLYVNSEEVEGKQPIYIDGDVTTGYAFGNHVTAIYNPDCINLNKDITSKTYSEKFAGSTFMTLLSLYDYDLTRCNEDKIFFYLMIDVWFKQYFKYRSKWDKWVNIMEMEYLNDIISYFTIEDYYDFLRQYRLNSKISICEEDGTLIFSLPYEKIKNDFGLIIPEPKQVFDTKVLDLSIVQTPLFDFFRSRKKDNAKPVFSNAMTFKDSVRYSLPINVGSRKGDLK